jgi:hypothetical protein
MEWVFAPNRQIAITGQPSADLQQVCFWPTRKSFDVRFLATPLGITEHDHIIVGKNGHASLRGQKLI